MKTKIFLIALAAITLLSFTLISSSRTSHKAAPANQNQSGFCYARRQPVLINKDARGQNLTSTATVASLI